MRIVWTLFKVAIAAAIAIPVGILALGLIGTLVGLLAVAVRLAVIGLVGYGLYRLVRGMFRSSPKVATAPRALPPRDPYYEAAMREIDSELNPSSRR
jgi:hypothetical protein